MERDSPLHLFLSSCPLRVSFRGGDQHNEFRVRHECFIIDTDNHDIHTRQESSTMKVS